MRWNLLTSWTQKKREERLIVKKSIKKRYVKSFDCCCFFRDSKQKKFKKIIFWLDFVSFTLRLQVFDMYRFLTRLWLWLYRLLSLSPSLTSLKHFYFFLYFSFSLPLMFSRLKIQVWVYTTNAFDANVFFSLYIPLFLHTSCDWNAYFFSFFSFQVNFLHICAPIIDNIRIQRNIIQEEEKQHHPIHKNIRKNCKWK
jgi:hypothetical protein